MNDITSFQSSPNLTKLNLNNTMDMDSALSKSVDFVKGHLEELKKSIEFLSYYPNVRIDDLRSSPIIGSTEGSSNIPYSDLRYNYDKVKLAASLFYDTDQYHIITDTLSHLNVPSNISPGTLGSFLFGCTGDTYGDVSNKFCSPLCVGSLLPSKQSTLTKSNPISPFTDFASPSDTNDDLCSVQVITIKGNKLFRDERSNIHSPNAYVFIEYPNTFNGLSRTQIDQLKQLGIKTVSVYDINERKHSVILNPTSVDQLPLNDTPSSTLNIPSKESIVPSILPINTINNVNTVDTAESIQDVNTSNIDTSNNVKSGTSWTTWIIVILIILLLLGLIVWGYNQYKNRYM